MTTDQAVSPMLERPVTVKAFGITDKGKVRPNNEDRLLIAELTKSMRVRQTPDGTEAAGWRGARTSLSRGRRHGRDRAGERASAFAVVAIESSRSIHSSGFLAQIVRFDQGDSEAGSQ